MENLINASIFAYLEKSSRKNDHTRNESFDKLFLTVR